MVFFLETIIVGFVVPLIVVMAYDIIFWDRVVERRLRSYRRNKKLVQQWLRNDALLKRFLWFPWIWIRYNSKNILKLKLEPKSRDELIKLGVTSSIVRVRLLYYIQKWENKEKMDKKEQDDGDIDTEITGDDQSCEELKIWLNYECELGEYYESFIINGYYDLKTIKYEFDKYEQHDRKALADFLENVIGVTIAGHQARLEMCVDSLPELYEGEWDL